MYTSYEAEVSRSEQPLKLHVSEFLLGNRPHKLYAVKLRVVGNVEDKIDVASLGDFLDLPDAVNPAIVNDHSHRSTSFCRKPFKEFRERLAVKRLRSNLVMQNPFCNRHPSHYSLGWLIANEHRLGDTLVGL